MTFLYAKRTLLTILRVRIMGGACSSFYTGLLFSLARINS